MIRGMRRLSPAIVLVVALVGCRNRPGTTTQPPSATPDSPASSDAEGDGTTNGQPNATAKPPACEGGAAWDGKADCLYEHGGCCYASPRAACEAAGCPPEHCRILEFRPAQARCEEPA